MFHSSSRLFLLGGLLLVLVACTPRPTVLPPATPLASETPVPALQAVELGMLGKGSALDMAWSPDGNWLAMASCFY